MLGAHTTYHNRLLWFCATRKNHFTKVHKKSFLWVGMEPVTIATKDSSTLYRSSYLKREKTIPVWISLTSPPSYCSIQREVPADRGTGGRVLPQTASSPGAV